MSGSIGASRIPHNAVQETLRSFIEKVLKGFPGFVSAKATGSTANAAKDSHGDIDIVVHVEGEDLKKVKKEFQAYLNSLPDNLTMPFVSGRNKGKKSQMYGTIITCQFPIDRYEGIGVQVDCNLVLSAEEQEYQNSFLDLPADKQGLLMGLARVILLEETPEKVFARLGIKKLPKLEPNQEFEFVLSGAGLTLRKVTLEDFREKSREDIWKTTSWQQVKNLFANYDISKDYDNLLADVASSIQNPRSKRRILGIMNSMINIGPGEVGTPKGDGKQRALDAAKAKLGTLEEIQEGTETIALYGGGFKPPHKAHFENAKKLCEKADRVIIFIGPKLRPGVPVTAEQSKQIWNIYKNYLSKPVEIRLSETSPITDIYKLLENEEIKDKNLIVAKSQGVEEDKKYQYLLKNKDKYPNVSIVTLPTIADKEDEKFSASTLRQSEDKIKEASWIPSCLGREDVREVLDILLKPLTREIIREGIFKAQKKAVDKALSIVAEGQSGIPIPPTTVISSENKAKLSDFYWFLEHELDPHQFEVKFNQSFILVKSVTKNEDELSDLYTALTKTYAGQFTVVYERGYLHIKPFVRPEWSEMDVTGGYNTDGQLQEEKLLDPDESYWAKNFAGLIQFMKDKGMKLDPLPDIILKKETQNQGLFDKTGNYNPASNVIEIYTAGRHPKDILATLAHELVHREQALDGKIKEINTDKVGDDAELKDLEAEAYKKGRLMMREYLDSLQK